MSNTTAGPPSSTGPSCQRQWSGVRCTGLAWPTCITARSHRLSRATDGEQDLPGDHTTASAAIPGRPPGVEGSDGLARTPPTARSRPRHAGEVTAVTEHSPALTYTSYLALDDVLGAQHLLGRARRDAVHRHPPGVRAVVQAAAPRARPPPAPPRGRRHPRAEHAQAHPHDPQGGGRADRRARDDDAPPVPRLPGRLEAASGFQSAQFRELEAVLGRRDPGCLRALPDEASDARARIAAAMARPSLFDSFLRYLASQGYGVPAGALARDVSRPLEPSAGVQRVLLEVYRDDGEPAAGRRAAGRPRRRHAGVALPPRQDGRAHHRFQAGTGGSPGAEYLRTTLSEAGVPRPVGHPERAVIDPRRPGRIANALAPTTPRFRRRAAAADRTLPPGVARRGARGAARAYDDAAELVDGKWDRAVARPTTCAPGSAGCSATPAVPSRWRQHARRGGPVPVGPRPHGPPAGW